MDCEEVTRTMTYYHPMHDPAAALAAFVEAAACPFSPSTVSADVDLRICNPLETFYHPTDFSVFFWYAAISTWVLEGTAFEGTARIFRPI